jgi:acyl-coenzyme A synthetase/AMP-(fatty) acid ligase
MAYLGRADNQIKVLGHRVELGEVESVVRSISGADAVVAIGWPSASNAEAIELFVERNNLDTEQLSRELKTKLPTYMLPRKIRVLEQLPLTPNGKFDRRALQQIAANS